MKILRFKHWIFLLKVVSGSHIPGCVEIVRRQAWTTVMAVLSRLKQTARLHMEVAFANIF
jgi:hypothetical protein